MKRRDLVAHLQTHGCKLLREGASHSWWGHAESGKRSAVPRHTEINNHLTRKICRDLGILEPA
ncbi:MAG: type II toxin-antitoxin system HicA family toxin [Betaproteobacteria bacterium]|nr:type II toxin-antitoxin system HicA family toxin [Betaproteobacteria bacterium]MCL2162069.1 type II toxin-antitoxin system HicA family toxin [Betaproteobacteria bacterium]